MGRAGGIVSVASRFVRPLVQGTAALCASFAREFGAEEQGRLIALLHDLHIYGEHFTTLDAGSLTSVGSYIFFYGLFTSVKVHEGDPCNIGSKVGEDKIIVRNHNFSVSVNETIHKCADCDATENHVFANDTDTTCDVCGYVRTVTEEEHTSDEIIYENVIHLLFTTKLLSSIVTTTPRYSFSLS